MSFLRRGSHRASSTRGLVVDYSYVLHKTAIEKICHIIEKLPNDHLNYTVCVELRPGEQDCELIKNSSPRTPTAVH